MQIKAKNNCPLNKFEPCKELDCAFFTLVRGTNPNTGAEIDEWGCAITWLPVLLIENANQSRQTGAAVESLRNVVAEDAERLSKTMALMTQPLHKELPCK